MPFTHSELARRFGQGAQFEAPTQPHGQRWHMIRGANGTDCTWRCSHCDAMLMKVGRKPHEREQTAYHWVAPCADGEAAILDSFHLRPQPVRRPQTNTGVVTPPYPWPEASANLLGLVEAGLRAGDRTKTFKKDKSYKMKQECTQPAGPSAAAPPII